MDMSSSHAEAIALLSEWKASGKRVRISLSAQGIVLTASCFVSGAWRIEDEGTVIFSDPSGDWRLSVGTRLARIETSGAESRVMFGFSEKVKLAAACP
jgi:hypothetical protein